MDKSDRITEVSAELEEIQSDEAIVDGASYADIQAAMPELEGDSASVAGDAIATDGAESIASDTELPSAPPETAESSTESDTPHQDTSEEEPNQAVDEGALPIEMEVEAEPMELAETSDPAESVTASATAIDPDAIENDTDSIEETLTLLPLDMVIADRYVIQSQLHTGPDRNLYRVTVKDQQRCDNCGRLQASGAETCTSCGSPLESKPPADFYLMAESHRPEALVQDPDLMMRHLYHPSLVPVVDFFGYEPVAKRRYYAVAEPRQGVRLSQMSLPRPAGQVLTWAMQLADALEYLHEQGVVGAGAEGDDILVQGDQASLASLQNARTATEEGEALQEQQSMDLARLAGTIYEAYTGNPPSLSPDGSLPMPSGAPEQIGSAFRSAIEPVQGTAPAISVAHWRSLLAGALEAITEMERPGRPVSFVAAHMTNVGRLREQNQDSYGIVEFTQASEERPYYIALYVVADGLGGHKGGEIASSIATQAFTSELMARVMAPLVAATGERPMPSNESILQAMTRAVQSANDRIYKARSSRQNDMGTTLVAVLILGGKAYITNVGDSRLYILNKMHEGSEQSMALDATRPLMIGTKPLNASQYLRAQGAGGAAVLDAMNAVDRTSGYELDQISVDHSLVHRLVELGQLDPEEAKVHPHRNFIYRSLGGPPPIEVDTFVSTLYPGDRILLCSDGLNSMVEDEDISMVLKSVTNPAEVCQRLINLANEAGGHDNITTVVIDVQDYLPYTEPI